MRLKIELPTTWAQHNNPNGPVTFCRKDSTCALQISWSEYGGKNSLPQVTADGLTRMATNFGQSHGFGQLMKSAGGPCKYGSFGTAIFRSEQYPRIQVWFISDGRDCIMATHICDQKPSADEVTEVQRIASTLALGPEKAAKPKWKFW